MRNQIARVPALVAIALFVSVTGEELRARSATDKIVLDARKTETGDGCSISVVATYPNDLAPQTRQLTISDTSSSEIVQSGTAELPRPANDPRPVDNGDGTSSHALFEWSYSPCGPVPLLIEIGACESGACPPMRVSAEQPEGVEVTATQ